MALLTQDQGCFGKVYSVTIEGKHAALKKVPSSYLTMKDIDREWRVYRSISHPNVVKLICDPWIDNECKWNIPLEYIHGNDLEKIMFTSNTSIQLTKAVTVKIISGICSGLRELHKNNIIHQDLKPDNIMVEYSTYRAVIIDLGLAKFERNGLFSGHEGGNRHYAAPEVVRGFRRDKASDVWAMGKIIAELLITPRARLPSSRSGKFIWSSLLGNPYRDPVYSMVRTNPKVRATMEDIMGQINNAGLLWK